VTLRTALTEAAHAAAQTKTTCLAAHHARIRARRGLSKAIGATRHDLLIAYWHVVHIHDQVDYADLGPETSAVASCPLNRVSWFRDRPPRVRPWPRASDRLIHAVARGSDHVAIVRC